MRRSIVLCAALATALAIPSVAPAATAEDFLNAPIWYVEYEVTFKSTFQGSSPSLHGSMTFSSSVERVFSATDKLNLRNQGPGALAMAALAPASDKKMTVAEQQAMSMKMMEQIDHTANWMAMGPAMDENPDMSAVTTPTSPFRIAYTCVDIGKGLVDETGGVYDLKKTTTIEGTATVLTASMGGLLMEMDTVAKTFVLTLPMGFDGQGAKVKQDVVTFTQPKGAAGNETRESSDILLNYLVPNLALDDATQGYQQGGVTIRGTIDPSKGKISGVATFAAHYTEHNLDAPGTLTYKYTLTMTPPAKK